MILPFEIWKMPRTTEAETKKATAAEEAHNDHLVELCVALGMELVGTLPKIAQPMAEIRGRSYGRTLALLLRHLDVKRSGRGESACWRSAEKSILDAFHKLAADGLDDLPAPINLLICSDYALAFPGGVYLRDILSLSLFLKGAGTELYDFQIARFDMFWADSMKRIAWEERRTAPPSSVSDPRKMRAPDLAILDSMPMPRDTNMAALRHNWLKEGRTTDWDAFVKWAAACRRSVKMPVQREKRSW